MINGHLEKTEVSEGIPNKYVKLRQSLLKMEPHEPLFLYNIQPGDMYERRDLVEKISLPYLVKVYTHRFGNYIGNFNFVWTTYPDEENERL